MKRLSTLNRAEAEIMKKIANVRKLFAVIALVGVSLFAHTNSYADVLSQGNWVKKQYGIKGGWEVVTENNQTIIRFDSSFKTKSGPDLKVFLSKQSMSQVTGKTATKDAILLSVLENNSGAQEYVVPADVDISQFQSLLIHCEAYSVLWGGGKLK